VLSVSDAGSRRVLGTIIPAAMRSAATTHAVAITGSPAIIQPTTPAPATAIRAISGALSPPTPHRIDRTKMRLVSTACAPAMARLQDAPSDRCERQTTMASTPQISHVPRCGRVVPRTMSRT
jgi:hypothetical protein